MFSSYKLVEEISTLRLAVIDSKGLEHWWHSSFLHHQRDYALEFYKLFEEKSSSTEKKKAYTFVVNEHTGANFEITSIVVYERTINNNSQKLIEDKELMRIKHTEL